MTRHIVIRPDYLSVDRVVTFYIMPNHALQKISSKPVKFFKYSAQCCRGKTGAHFWCRKSTFIFHSLAVAVFWNNQANR